MNTEYQTLKKDQYLSNLFIDISEKYIMIVSPTGSGKTEWAVNTFAKFDMLYPTKINGEQKSEKYHLHFVKEGINPNSEDKQFGTFDAIRKFTKRNCSDRTLIIDESHHHILSASENFRRDTIHALVDAFDKYERIILLTGTPIETTHSIINQFKIYKVAHNEFENYRYNTISCNSEISSLEHYLIKNAVNFVFCNDKKRIEFLSEYFETKGYKTGIITSDTLGDTLSSELIKTYKIDKQYNIVFVTSVISECIDILNENLGSVQFITREDPSTVKQFVSRFRNKKPQKIYIYASFSKDSLEFSIQTLEKQLKDKANKKLSLFNALLDEDMIQKEAIVNAVREDMKSEFIHMFRVKDNRYTIDETGIAYLVRQKYVAAIYTNKTLFEKALGQYEMDYTGHIYCSKEPSDEEKEYIETIKVIQRHKKKRVFDEELETYKEIGKDKTMLFRNKSEYANRILHITEEYAVSFDTSITLIKDFGFSTQKYNILLKQMNILRYRKNKATDCEGSIDKILKSFVVSKKYTGDEIFTILHNILSNSDFYDAKITEAKAIRTLRNFFSIKRCKIKDKAGKYLVNGYKIINNNPLITYLPKYL